MPFGRETGFYVSQNSPYWSAVGTFQSPLGIGMADLKNSAETRLATYGTLAPGRVNNGQLADLEGRWCQGIVRGKLVEAGWGAELGYPGLILDGSGEVIEVFLFESLDLPNHWPRLDAFEGTGYRRVVTQVSTLDGDLDASIYVIDVRPG